MLGGRAFTLMKFTPYLHLATPSSRVPLESTGRMRKYTSDDRDASYRTLVRDVILGCLAVIVLSLGVPAWIIRVEYSKTYGTVLGPGFPP